MEFSAWVWPDTDREPSLEPASGPGPGWQKVGALSSVNAPYIAKVIQRTLGIGGGTDPARVTGYLDGDGRRHEWVQRVAAGTDPGEFPIAFGPVGNVGDTYLVSSIPAALGRPQSRPPEPHAGTLVAPEFIGVTLRKHEGAILKRHG